MVVLIGEITSSFQSVDESYELSFRGIVAPASLLDENNIKFRIIGKISQDCQGEAHKNLLVDYKWSDEDSILTSPLLSSVMIDYDTRLKGTAPASIEKDELLSLLEPICPDWIVLTESILSVEPAASSISAALKALSKKPSIVVYQDAIWPYIESLECLKSSIETLSEDMKVYVMGESVDVQNSIKIERDHFVDLIK